MNMYVPKEIKQDDEVFDKYFGKRLRRRKALKPTITAKLKKTEQTDLNLLKFVSRWLRCTGVTPFLEDRHFCIKLYFMLLNVALMAYVTCSFIGYDSKNLPTERALLTIDVILSFIFITLCVSSAIFQINK